MLFSRISHALLVNNILIVRGASIKFCGKIILADDVLDEITRCCFYVQKTVDKPEKKIQELE